MMSITCPRFLVWLTVMSLLLLFDVHAKIVLKEENVLHDITEHNTEDIGQPFAPIKARTTVCEDICHCDIERNWAVDCTNIQNISLADVFNHSPVNTKALNITHASFMPTAQLTGNSIGAGNQVLTNLSYFAVIDSGLSVLNRGIFHRIPNLKELDLSFNILDHVSVGDFENLHRLQVLNLSHNLLKEISEHALWKLSSLQRLDLSYNKLVRLSKPKVFQSLLALQYLDLSHNQLKYIHPRVFFNLNNLQTLHLEFNQLGSLQSDIFSNLTQSPGMRLYIAHNPWNCHCGVEWIMTELQSESRNRKYMDINNVICWTPKHIEEMKVINLSPSHLHCEEPDFFFGNESVMPNNISIEFMHSGFLHCSAGGYPKPIIYWLSPRGVLVHESQHEWLPAYVHEFSDMLEFASGPTYFKATVRALENGSLSFHNFRNNFVGEYTCVAVNPLGNVSTTVNVQVHSRMVHHLIFGVIFGGFCSLVALFLAIGVGSIQWVAERTCCKKDLEKSAIEIYYSEDVPPKAKENEAVYWEQYFRYLPYEYPDPTSRQSPMKCVTPAELVDAEENQSQLEDGIWQTLDEARTNLRQTLERQMERMRLRTSTMRESSRQLKTNVGKKVDHVRYKAQRVQQSSSTYVHSLKESSSTKLKTIRESSSQYALRMRSNFTYRVDAAKDQVKSFKEFCGTGDMVQTMSVASVSTNVDSQKQIVEYKTHTLI